MMLESPTPDGTLPRCCRACWRHCSPPARRQPAAAPAAAPAADKVKIGFLYVGPADDYGYNYAADQGRLYLQKQLGDKVETVSAENVPEDANAERVMEQMISDGATIIFPTSYGHFNPAVNESKKHPDVDFLHQGGLSPDATTSAATSARSGRWSTLRAWRPAR